MIDPKKVTRAMYALPGPTPIETDSGTDELESWWLPEPVRDWVDACAAAYCVPKVMPIAAALCAASVLVQGKARVRIHPAWEEELSLYWLIFAPTGMAKSGVMRAAMAPIRAIQAGLEEEMRPVAIDRTNERARLEAQIARMRRATKAHKYTDGSQEHLQQLRELEHDLSECEVPKVPEWLYTDANPTVLPRLMAHNLEAEGIARVAVCDAEGTFLANLLGRHSGHLNVDPLLTAYSGDPIEMVRTVHGSKDLQKWRMPSSHMVMCVMVQPHYLDKLKAHPELGDNGWLGRCLMSRVSGATAPTPFERPEIPEAIQSAYAAWLKAAAEVPSGTVYAIPPELRERLESFHHDVETSSSAMKGAVGWMKRSLGRICRIIALMGISDEAMKAMKTSSGGSVPANGAAREGIGKIFDYLSLSLYSRALSHAQAIEPERATLPALCRRTLGWLHRFNSSSANRPVTLREIYARLHISKSAALAACDALCESGHLSLVSETKRGSETLTATYAVISTDPDCGSDRALKLVPPSPDDPPF